MAWGGPFFTNRPRALQRWPDVGPDPLRPHRREVDNPAGPAGRGRPLCTSIRSRLRNSFLLGQHPAPGRSWSRRSHPEPPITAPIPWSGRSPRTTRGPVCCRRPLAPPGGAARRGTAGVASAPRGAGRPRWWRQIHAAVRAGARPEAPVAPFAERLRSGGHLPGGHHDPEERSASKLLRRHDTTALAPLRAGVLHTTPDRPTLPRAVRCFTGSPFPGRFLEGLGFGDPAGVQDEP